MARDLGSSDHRIRLLAPSWFSQVFTAGTTGSLLIDGALQSDLVRAVDADPLTHGFGIQIGVRGRAAGSNDVLTGNHIVRGPLYRCKTMLTIIVGPELSKPPTAPSPSRTHQIVAELFSMTLTCGLAVAGWIGAITSVAASGVTSGASMVATVFFTNAAAMSTVQCVGGIAHSGLVLSSNDDKAKAMEDDAGWQAIDRAADYFNLFSPLYVGRDAILVKRALERSGVTFSSAMAADFSDAKAVTMSDILRLAPDIRNPEQVAREVRQRVMNVALLGLGVYSSSRDASGGYTQVKEIMVGKDDAPAPAPTPAGSPQAQAAAPGVIAPLVQVGLPGPGTAGMVAPKAMDTMLNYKSDEVAMISVLLLKKDF